MSVTIFVEGGGESSALKTRCREAFRQFLRGGIPGKTMPRIVPCGSRMAAFDKFCTAVRSPKKRWAFLLLVDAEEVVEPGADLWAHVKSRPGDHWGRPKGATADQLQFMAVCMESWLLADADGLATFYGNGFAKSKLPKTANLESVCKEVVFQSLKVATKSTTKGEFRKGKQAFEALGACNIGVVRKKMFYCDRLIKHLMKES